jgi:hypothetical protein
LTDPGGGRLPELVLVLGMHRSGTSAVTGLLEDQGMWTGAGPGGTVHSPRGTRENPRLRRLHQRILRHNGATWWRPPEGPVEVRPRHRARRDAILSEADRPIAAVKDPRVLLLLELWRDLPARRIGVIRNPVSVADSLLARGGPATRLGFVGCVGLWKRYSRALLGELERDPFPVVDFDRGALPEHVSAALERLGLAGDGPTGFFEPAAVRHAAPDWRERVGDAAAVELWERLERFASGASDRPRSR